MSEEPCLFCSISNKTLPSHIVYEDEEVIALLDIKPVNPGHVLVLPKKHFRNFLDLPEKIAAHLALVAQKISRAVKNATKSDGINISSNNEHAAGQLIFHTHLHIIPRFEGDGLMHWDHNFYKSDSEMPRMAEKIRDSL